MKTAIWSQNSAPELRRILSCEPRSQSSYCLRLGVTQSKLLGAIRCGSLNDAHSYKKRAGAINVHQQYLEQFRSDNVVYDRPIYILYM